MAGDVDYEIPESGAVFTFGRSKFADNLSSHFFIRNDPVVEISCGDEHTAVVCKSGRVFLFGQNDYGQLGFGHKKAVNKPTCLKYLKPFHSNHVACGKTHTIISTMCGRIFTFGCNSDGQLGVGDFEDRLIPQMVILGLSEDDNISTVSAGCYHSAFLTKRGEIYLWGSNSDGQCGWRDNSNLPTPHKLEFEYPITSLSCGYYHTAFISLGHAYTFGEEENGKLGRVTKSTKNEPEKVDVLEKCKLVKCGGSHTFLLTDPNSVYAFGSNFSGQLGIGNSNSESSIPIKVQFPENVKIVDISCGESHSAFLSEDGNLYTCGDSRHGKLCNEDESTNFFKPTLITAFENYFCTSVSCGGCHTMVLARISKTNANLDVRFNHSNKEVLPPLISKPCPLESPKDITKPNLITKEPSEKEHLNYIKDNDECDSKFQPENNLQNDEAISHSDEIYTEIRELEPQLTDNHSTDFDSKLTHQNKETQLAIQTKSDGTLMKLTNIFKRKKSVTAILVNDKQEEKGTKNEGNSRTGNQQKSKACVLL